MLTYAIERLVLKRQLWDVPLDEPARLAELVDYRAHLQRNGFLFRRYCVDCEDLADHVVYFCGILGYHSALEDARSHPEAALYCSRVDSGICAERTVQRLALNVDSHYCDHQTWDSLLLQGDHVFGGPPFACWECGGLVAPYRLNLSPEAAWLVGRWVSQHDLIDDLWTMSADYESSAEKELLDIHSTINELGLSAVASVAKDLGCEVNYLFHTGDKRFDDCPRCGGSLRPMPGRGNLRRCPECSIVL